MIEISSKVIIIAAAIVATWFIALKIVNKSIDKRK
jgi:hypothetical protein